MNKKDFRRKLLHESSTSDGATLYVVLNPLPYGNATIDDIFVEIQNEMELIHLILGQSKDDLESFKIFVNKNAAMDLANTRLSIAELGGPVPPKSDAVDLTFSDKSGTPPYDGGVVNQTRGPAPRR